MGAFEHSTLMDFFSQYFYFHFGELEDTKTKMVFKGYLASGDNKILPQS